MSGPLYKRIDCDVEYMISAIDKGTIGLPDIQRPFIWSAAKVRDLFDSMFRGYPIGSLLSWAAPENEGKRQTDTDEHGTYTPTTLILDGQQRLTSLYAVMKGKPVLTEDSFETNIAIAFKPSTSEFEVSTVAHSHSPEWIPNISELYLQSGEAYKITSQFIGRLAERRKLLSNENETIAENIQRLLQFRKFPITMLEITSDATEEDVADIFIRINSQGQTLNQGDFILTLISAFWEEGRNALATFCEQSRKPGVKYVSSYNYFIEPNPVQMTRVTIGFGFHRVRLKDAYLILRGKNLESRQCSPEQRDRLFERFKWAQMKALYLQNWHEFLEVPASAGYRSASMISSEPVLINAYVLYLIGKYDFNIESHLLRNIIGQWFFMSSITSRYSNSPESRMEQDLAKLRTIKESSEFIDYLQNTIDGELTPDFWTTRLPIGFSTDDACSPSWSAYCAALNLLEAPALFSQVKVPELLDPITTVDKATIGQQRLFSKNYLAKIGIKDDLERNQLANFAFVEWNNNLHTPDSPPEEYLPQYIEQLNSDPEHLTQILTLHALPDQWEHMPYDEFLIKRRGLLAKVTKQGYQHLANITKDNNPSEISSADPIDLGEADMVEN